MSGERLDVQLARGRLNLMTVGRGLDPGRTRPPIPRPGPHEIVVRVRASSADELEFAGVVERVGPGVSRYSAGDDVFAGDEVFGFISEPERHDGRSSEYAVVPEDMFVAPKPWSLGFVAAAALPRAGATAVLAVDAVDPSGSDTLLVAGAGSTVGGYVVQLAAERGTTVIAIAGAGDAERLRKIGVFDTIDPARGDVAAAVRARYPKGVDALVDLASRTPDDFAAIARLVRNGGVVATTLGAAVVYELPKRGVTVTTVAAVPDSVLLSRVAAYAEAGELDVRLPD